MLEQLIKRIQSSADAVKISFQATLCYNNRQNEERFYIETVLNRTISTIQQENL